MTYHTLDPNVKEDHTRKLAFLDTSGTTTVARYDRIKYKVFDRLTENQLSFFWRPEEIALDKDSSDFRMLTSNEQHIFTSNLKRQIILDSVQGRAPNLALLPLVSLPELEIWIQTWAFFETIHSKSYTHIIRNVYSDPTKVLDEMMHIQPIVDCTRDITQYYDDLINYTMLYHSLGEGEHTINGNSVTVSRYELKKRLWLALNSINVLEGIRFYVSFACSFAFGELKKMEGNAKIIKLICRDENLHLGSTQTLLKLLPKDDPDYTRIREETMDTVIGMFDGAVEQEISWCNYLFQYGSIIGLNAPLLTDYVMYIAGTRMDSLAIPHKYKVKNNPLPWTLKWISGKEVQVSPQETQLSSYRVGDAKMDVTDNTFNDLSL
jgi:ribonucleoside-diphosphate reductase beta chain